MTNAFVYIGNWKEKPSSWETGPAVGRGIGICKYDPETGDLEPLKSVLGEISAGAVCLDARRNILYCTDESLTLPGYALCGGGQVIALAIDPQTGDLTEINRQPSFAPLPCYVTVDAESRYLLTVNHSGHMPITRSVRDASGKYRIDLEYDDGTTVLYPLGEDGSIGEACDIYKHSGKGPLPKQHHAKPHSVVMSPSGRLFAVCEWGSDRIYLFRINRETQRLEVCGGKGYQTIPASSPRYSFFHPRRPYFYVNYETKALIDLFRYDEEGRLERIGTVSGLPEGCADHLEMKQSDMRLHPSGRFVYLLIRGINAVSVFALDEKTGGLERIQTVTLDGLGPRGCAVSPDGRFLIIAALTSQEVLVWAIGEDGKLSPTGKKTGQPSPGNVTFFPA